MNLDDGMLPPKRRVPWWIIAAAVGVAVLAVTFAGGNPEPSPPQPVTTPAPPPATEPHEREPAAPADAWRTAVVFLTGWTSINPDSRTAAFRESALPGLADGLALTETSKIVTDPIEQIVTVAAEPYSVEFQVTFARQDDPVWLLLTNGHGDPDWRVTQIDQRPA